MNQIKPFERMSQQEKEIYKRRVETWLETASLADVKAQLTVWTETSIKEYREGVLLCCAFQNYIPTMNQASREESLRWVQTIHKYLKAIRNKSELKNLKSLTSDDNSLSFYANVPTPQIDADGNNIDNPDDNKKPEDYVTEFEGRIPTHLDDYRHLLSPELQQIIDDPTTGINALYLQRAHYHEKASRADDLNMPAEVLKPLCETIVECEAALRALWAKVDAEREIIFGAGNNVAVPEKPDAKKRMATKADIDAMEDSEEKGVLKNKRVQANLKYLRRKDVNNEAERELRLSELREWNIEIPGSNG